MLSVLFGEQFDIFRQILNFYKPNYSKVLDLTYGKGTLWKSKAKQEYILTTVDIDPNTNAQFHCDFNNLPVEITSCKYDIIVYDPPYKYHSQSFILHDRKSEMWKNNTQRTVWTLDEQINNAKNLNKTLPEILNDDGIFIVKIMDTREKGQLILNHILLIQELSNFVLKDILIYVKLGIGIFSNDKTPQTAHGFFLIFKKPQKEGAKNEK